jgi:hypothetical protein
VSIPRRIEPGEQAAFGSGFPPKSTSPQIEDLGGQKGGGWQGGCGRISPVNRTRLSAVFILIIAASALPPQSVSGAEGDTAYLSGLDSSQFPQISAYLSVSNSLGERLAGLTAQELSLKEDDSPARNVALTEEQTGLRLVVVMDPGPGMIFALPEGETRIQRIRRTMTDWLGTFPQSGMDDLTLITPDGIPVSHASDPEAFLDGLQAYTPKIPSKLPLDALLVDALDAAADPLPRPGMRALLIVFSASKLTDSGNIAKGLCPRALELHATLFGIWSGRSEPSAMPDMESLAALASACGGYSVALESSTGTATMLSMITTQRIQYRVEFRSSISSSGEHALTAAVERADFQTQSAPVRFSLEIRPPDVSWIDFPDRLTRKGSEVSQPVEAYLPDAVELKAEVVFPDGHPREIVSMQLFADNKLAGECAAASCAGIRWDLRPYTESGDITLQMVVRDELGLEGKTAERKLTLTVKRPSFWEVFQAYYLLPATIVLAAAAAVGFLIAAMVNWNRVRAAQAANELLFPNAPSAPVQQAAGWTKRLRQIARRKRTAPKPPGAAYAVLEALGEEGRRFEIAAPDVIIGRDPQSAGIVLDDPSVSPRHGRIVRMGDGIPWVFDLGSAAGSWKNFEEVPPEGASLREGDRLNFGRAAFRVRLKPYIPVEETINER